MDFHDKNPLCVKPTKNCLKQSTDACAALFWQFTLKNQNWAAGRGCFKEIGQLGKIKPQKQLKKSVRHTPSFC